jgi:cell division protein FtsQ
MERFPAARLGHAIGLPAPPAWLHGGAGRLAGVLGRGLSRLAGTLRAHRRLRLAAIGAAVALPLLGGGWMWLRSSPLTAVEHVRIEGVHGAQAGQIEGALADAARRMSTLAVSASQLRAAVAAYPVVRQVRASASFPHTLRIAVVEQQPAAELLAGGVRTAVAGDGVALGEALLRGGLPKIEAAVAPLAGKRLRDAGALSCLAVVSAAPAPLARAIARVYVGPRGVTVAMKNGLLAYFGDAGRPHAKWLSLIAVLADHGSAGAGYVDVRVPERPAAGGFAAGEGPAPTAQPATVSGAAGGREATVAALAEALSPPGSEETKGAAAPSAGTTSAPPNTPETKGPSGESAAAGAGATSVEGG